MKITNTQEEERLIIIEDEKRIPSETPKSINKYLNKMKS
jgi:hypothetical protein